MGSDMRVITRVLLCLVTVILVAGCAGLNTYRVATGPDPFHKYDLPIYATENVPFEYEELGIVRAVGWVYNAWPDQSKCVEAMVKDAKSLGADAVIRVKILPFAWSDGFMLVLGSGGVDVQGVAVKIKRP